jgi:hypothetical protein
MRTIGVTGAATGILVSKGATAAAIIILIIIMIKEIGANPDNGLIVIVNTIIETTAKGATPTEGATAQAATEIVMIPGAAVSLTRMVGATATETTEAAVPTAETTEVAVPTTETTVATAPTARTIAATTETTAVTAPTKTTTKVGKTTVDLFLRVPEEETKVGIVLSRLDSCILK